MPHGITQCYLPPGKADIPALIPQPKLVLDLATPEGCKAELTVMAWPRESRHEFAFSSVQTLSCCWVPHVTLTTCVLTQLHNAAPDDVSARTTSTQPTTTDAVTTAWIPTALEGQIATNL